MVNSDYDYYDDDYGYYTGNRDADIIRDAGGEQIPCCDCPWFDVCQAMDDLDGDYGLRGL